MSESIDWSDPSKLQRRDGGKVVACGKTNTGINGEEYWAVTESPQGGPAVALYWQCGRYTMGIDCDRDIVTRTREPRTFYGWMRPDVFASLEQFGGNVMVQSQQTASRTMRVRITEVCDE